MDISKIQDLYMNKNKSSGTFLISLTILLASLNVMAQPLPSEKAAVEQILKNIQPPEFKDTVYNITTFGAVADGQTDNKAIFDKVINLCSVNGGGKVVVSKGVFYIAGPVVLK